MNSDRIKELQKKTAHPNSRSVAGALFQVWNECTQENNLEKKELESQLQSAHFKILDLQRKLNLISRIAEPSNNFLVRC